MLITGGIIVHPRMESESAVDSLEFVIDKVQSEFVEAAEKRIHYLFGVKIEFKEVFTALSQQWIKVLGPKSETGKAKEYILALASPAETIRVKNIWEHPLFTLKRDEIERVSCAVLSKCDEDDSLVITGTEYSVMLAQSMIDDILSKTIDSVTDKKPDSEGARHTGQDDDSGVDCAELCCSESDISEMRGNALLNKNNSSLTSVLPQSLSVSKLAGAHYADSFLTSDPRSSSHHGITLSPHKGTASSLHHPFSSSGSGGYATCSSTLGKGVSTEKGMDMQAITDGRALHWNNQKNERTVTEQASVGRTLFLPHEILSSNNSTFASASAIPPLTLGTHLFGPSVPKFGSGAAQPGSSLHILNHAGDGRAAKAYFPAYPQHSGHGGYGEVPVDTCSLDPSLKAGSSGSCPQTQDQQTYLRNLGQSLHYTNEDIERGLACYSMDNIVRPVEFLNTLNRIKGQRHGMGCQNISTASRENPSASHTSSVSTVPDTIAEMADIDDYNSLDASVICMGTVSNNSTVLVSSEEEDEELEEATHPVAPRNLSPSPLPHYSAGAFSERQLHVRREMPEHTERDATGIRDSSQMGDDFTASQRPTGRRNLRYIIIDGSNVAMAHGNDRVFSVEGLKICINYFKKRGHDNITVFVPEWRRYSENQTSITGRALLERLHNEGYVKFTPARRVNGRTIASYDDRFILNLAEKENGIVVSNDQFRDLCLENPNYRKIVENQLLQFMFVGDHFMPPDDPLGRHGPHLDDFLRYPQQPQEPTFNNRGEMPEFGEEETLVVNLEPAARRNPKFKRNLPVRNQTVTSQLFEKLTQLFPEPSQVLLIRKVLQNHKRETDLNRLTNYCMNAM